MDESCPAHLDAEGREIWRQCRWIIEGGAVDAGFALQFQALAICRELRQESRANQLQAEVERLQRELDAANLELVKLDMEA